MTDRPRRSALYMPGSNPRALEKARSLPADSLILDLEDAVAPAEKKTARELVCAALSAGGFGPRELIVRVNGLDTEWGADDLAAAATSSADAVLIPKVESAEMIHAVERALTEHGNQTAKIWAMMETPLGMLNAQEIAASSERLTCFVLGTNDLVKDLGASHTNARTPIITALGLCMLAGRAYGLTVLDGVYNAFRDAEGLRASCLQGREMGFDGKTLIHPLQLEAANEVFSPSPEDLEMARKYVDAFADAEAAGKGVAVVDGRIVENLHVEMAKKQLAIAEAIRKFSEGAAS